MPSTYTTNAGFEKIATGEQDGTWGDTVNYNMDQVDVAINGGISITLPAAGSSGSPNTLDITEGTIDEGLNKYIIITDGGDLGADVFVQLTPAAAEKVCYIRNSLSGSQDLYLFQGTYDASRDYVLAAGDTAVVFFSGGGASASYVTEIMAAFDPAAPGAIGGTTPAPGTFTTLSCTGAFTSLGVNDDATAERLKIEDTLLSVGSTGNARYHIGKPTSSGTSTYLSIGSDPVYTTGASITLCPAGHSTVANDIIFYAANGIELRYDHSASKWDFQANAIDTSGTLTSGTHTISSDLALATGSITSASGAISFGNENLSTTGTLSCGALTSTGIDDNASQETLEISNDQLTLRASGTLHKIFCGEASKAIIIGGDVNGTTGGIIQLYGGSHASIPNDIILKAGGSNQLYFDYSTTTWDFQANDITTSGDVNFTGLPTSDPVVAGRLWNSSGTLMVSAG